MQMRVDTESWAYKVPFRVSRGAESALDVVVVTLTDSHGHVGRGEAAGVDYEGETVPYLCAQIEAIRPVIERGAAFDFASLAALLPSGGARNAVDCALWDLTAKQRRTTVWHLAGFTNPRRLTTSITTAAATRRMMLGSAVKTNLVANEARSPTAPRKNVSSNAASGIGLTRD